MSPGLASVIIPCWNQLEFTRPAWGINDTIHPIDWGGVYWRRSQERGAPATGPPCHQTANISISPCEGWVKAAPPRASAALGQGGEGTALGSRARRAAFLTAHSALAQAKPLPLPANAPNRSMPASYSASPPNSASVENSFIPVGTAGFASCPVTSSPRKRRHTQLGSIVATELHAENHRHAQV